MALIAFLASQPSLKPSTVANEKGIFTQITCSAAGNILVKGTGIKQYIAAGSVITAHIDAVTGITGVGNAPTGGGLYEALPTTVVTIAMIAGDIINGGFTEVATGTGFKGWGHASVSHNTIFA